MGTGGKYKALLHLLLEGFNLNLITMTGRLPVDY